MIVTILWRAIVAAILPMHLGDIIATLPFMADRLVSSASSRLKCRVEVESSAMRSKNDDDALAAPMRGGVMQRSSLRSDLRKI